MIRDYKSRIDHRPRGHRKSRRLLFGAAVLVATLGMVRFLDISAKPEQASVPADPQSKLSMPLSLPNSSPPALQEPDSDTPPREATSEPRMLPLLRPGTATDSGPSSSTPATATSSQGTAPTLAMPEAAPKAAELPRSTKANPQPSLLASLAVNPGAAPPIAIKNAAAPTFAEPELPTPETKSRWVDHRVAPGDSLARIFAAQELEPSLLHRIVNSGKQAKTLARIQPGQTLRFEYDGDDLVALEHHRSRTEQLRVTVSDDGIESNIVSKAVDTRTASAAGVIQSSLFLDGQKAGLSDAKIMELADIFGWDVDFALEIRAGDEFRVVYEEHFLDGEKLRDGPILAAEFTNRGNTFVAVRYETEDGEVGYYDDTGHSKRRAFLRTPIKFARISSRFNPKRWHPVLKRWRAHKGVDYAAPTGTPIKASGDGKVIFRGTKSGYGRTVIIQHAGKYTTLYAHMSKYSKRSRKGARVKQGQVIGYVGKSGLATGPHLHYEFRVNGVHKDPLRVKLPKSLALPKKELPAFKAATAPLLARLDDVRGTMVATADKAE